MGIYVAKELIKKMKKKRIRISSANILIMGLTFKENCADIRNSGVESVIFELKKYNCNIDLYDPWADNQEIRRKYKTNLKKKLKRNKYDSIFIAVAHDKFKILGLNKIKRLCKKNYVIYDLKNLFEK